MRFGGIFAAAAAPLLAGACAAPAPLACADRLSVHFAEGRAELNLDAVGKVLRTASTLETCERARATVTGHAGQGEMQSLAGVRAANVASVLAKAGIEGKRIRVARAAADVPASREPDNRYVSISWE